MVLEVDTLTKWLNHLTVDPLGYFCTLYPLGGRLKRLKEFRYTDGGTKDFKQPENISTTLFLISSCASYLNIMYKYSSNVYTICSVIMQCAYCMYW